MNTLSLDQMVAYGHQHARHMLIGRNDVQLAPIVHIQFNDRPAAILCCPCSDEREKCAFIATVRAALRELRPQVVNYASLTEGWMVTQDRPWRNGDLRPSQRESRQECVVIDASDGLDSRLRLWEILRDVQGRITDLVALPTGDGPSSGRMVNLFEEE
jgi:hypothetical protein